MNESNEEEIEGRTWKLGSHSLGQLRKGLIPLMSYCEESYVSESQLTNFGTKEGRRGENEIGRGYS